jgi:hypothetical protein
LWTEPFRNRTLECWKAGETNTETDIVAHGCEDLREISRTGPCPVRSSGDGVELRGFTIGFIQFCPQRAGAISTSRYKESSKIGTNLHEHVTKAHSYSEGHLKERELGTACFRVSHFSVQNRTEGMDGLACNETRPTEVLSSDSTMPCLDAHNVKYLVCACRPC